MEGGELQARIAVGTGVPSSIGIEITRGPTRPDASVAMAVRDPGRGEAVRRDVTLAAEAHRRSELDLDDLQMAGRRNGWTASCRPKLARRPDGRPVTATCPQPGLVATGLGRWVAAAIRWGFRLFSRGLRSPVRRADSAVWAAASDEVADASGGYYMDRRRMKPSVAARDERTDDGLWRASADLVGIDLGLLGAGP